MQKTDRWTAPGASTLSDPDIRGLRLGDTALRMFVGSGRSLKARVCGRRPLSQGGAALVPTCRRASAVRFAELGFMVFSWVLASAVSV